MPLFIFFFNSLNNLIWYFKYEKNGSSKRISNLSLFTQLVSGSLTSNSIIKPCSSMVIAGFGNKTFLKAKRPCSYSWREAGDTLVSEARNQREKHVRGHRMLKLKKSLEI